MLLGWPEDGWKFGREDAISLRDSGQPGSATASIRDAPMIHFDTVERRRP